MLKKACLYSSKGFGLIESIIAVSIFIITAVTGTTTVLHSYSVNRLGDENSQATLYAQEGLDAVRSIRNQGWDDPFLLTDCSSGCGLSDSAGYWQFAGSTNTSGSFTRQVTVAPVYRDENGNIVTSGGEEDVNTRKITSVVSWDFSSIRHNQIELVTYLIHWDKEVLDVAEGFAFICGNQTTSGTNFNQSSTAAILWNEVVYDENYFTYDGVYPTRIIIEENGDYLLALTQGFYRTDITEFRTRVRSEVRVNGIKQNVGVARSSYISNADNQSESSNHFTVLLRNLSAGDYVEIFSQGATAITGAGYEMLATDRHCISLEYIDSSKNIFTATATQTVAGTDLNNDAEQAIQWQEGRKDAIFNHNDTASSENIVFNNSGNYLVFINIPLQSTGLRVNLYGRVKLDGAAIAGGEFKQGYIRNADSDNISSIHWSGVVRASSGQTLTVTLQREANTGTITVGGEQATIYIQELPAEGLYFSRASDLTTGSEWNPVAPGQIRWVNDDLIDASLYSHSTSVSPQQITILEAGDYLLVYNDAMVGTVGRPNNRISVLINGVALAGAETKTHYIRGSNDHNNSSGSLVFLLNDLSVNDVISLEVSQEADTDPVNDSSDALLLLWYKSGENNYPNPSVTPGGPSVTPTITPVPPTVTPTLTPPPTPTTEPTITPTVTPTPGYTTCSQFCQGQLPPYINGVCRNNANQCTQNGEVYESSGDAYCSLPMKSCCCVP